MNPQRSKQLPANAEAVRTGGEGAPRKKRATTYEMQQIPSSSALLEGEEPCAVANFVHDEHGDYKIVKPEQVKQERKVRIKGSPKKPGQLVGDFEDASKTEEKAAGGEEAAPAAEGEANKEEAKEEAEGRGQARGLRTHLLKPSASCMADPTAAKSHALVLRVMRLSKPKFHEAITMAVDPADEFAADIAQGLQNFTGQESAEIPFTNFLMAPQSIDNIYLGETFSFYLTIALNSKFQDQQARLEPQSSIGHVISHKIKETGQHILVCEVN
ncbi:hypothetical protein M3Y99_01760400 [Aphelenchoides fujianensis]|nr:hypothetical protein M3Y99_01760400 [Aphelenchoides fujianensis]